MENIYSVVITAITVLGGTTAFRFYEKRAMRKERDEEFIRHDCKDRITKLETLLVESSKEKDELRSMVLALTKEAEGLKGRQVDSWPDVGMIIIPSPSWAGI